MSVPALRFPEFEGEWERRQLSQIAGVARGKFSARPRNDPQFFGGETPFVQTGDVVNADRFLTRYTQTLNDAGVAVSRVFPKGTILITIAANIGDVAITDFPVACPDSLIAINAKEDHSTEFLYEYLGTRKNELVSYATQNAQANINLQVLEPLQIPSPSHPEQKKIAVFLGVVDAKIAALRERRAGLERYKRGLMQALFSQTLRFTKPDGSAFPDWEEKRLGDVLLEHKAKSTGKEEVFSVSVHKGLVNQIEHLGRSFSAANTDHYNRVKQFDIVYTKSPTGDFPLGIIKQSHIAKDVIVSPLYGVFTPETPALGRILHVHFESNVSVSNYLSPIVQKGAKNTINVTNSGFLSNKLNLPSDHGEQAKIADALSAMDAKIAAVGDQVAKMEAFKKGLLQQMFV